MATKLIPYKFTNKKTGELQYGIPHTFGHNYVEFRLNSGENVRVENPDQDGHALTNEEYDLAVDESYSGKLPTWGTE